MADPLSVLRQFNIGKKPIIEEDEKIIFGDLAWPKNAKTNFLAWGTGREGTEKEYYTLECILFLLKNVGLAHALYVRQAAAESVPVVRRPDRKELLAYLTGETETAPQIDKSAPIEIALQRPAISADANNSEIPSKKARIDDENVISLRERITSKLNAPKEQSLATDNISSLSDALTKEAIAAIKAKRLAKKRTTIKGGSEDDKELLAGGLGEADAQLTRDILSRERVWRSRTTILQSSGKQFKSILNMIASIKAREEGPSAPRVVPKPPSPVAAPQKPDKYDRYDQERFRGSQETASIGFKIDTTGTYHGLTLKSVTEGATAKKVPPTSAPKPLTEAEAPVPQKRTSRTPIIIIPASTSSLVTMYNVKDFLQECRFVLSEEKRSQGVRREGEVLIQRKRDGGLTVPYRVIDNPSKLVQSDWDRVVAVFSQGPAWQFKGWPYGGNPVDIFARIKGFHLKWSDQNLDNNIGKWSVTVIQLDRHKRHLDRARVLAFWDELDRFMAKNKPHLRQ